MFVPAVAFVHIHARADTNDTTATTAASSSTASSNSASTTASFSSTSISAGSSTSSSSASSSSSSTSVSSSSTSASSTQSSSTTNSASSTSATASATHTSQPSSGSKVNIGAIVGGVIAGIAVLTLLSIIFTALRRKRRNAHKRPRGSVYLDNVDQRFLEQKPRPNVSSVSSSVPLLSIPQDDSELRNEAPTQFTDTPAESRMPSPYSDHGHGAAPEADQTYGEEGDSQSGHSGHLPSPYSQHGHNDEAVAGVSQARSMVVSQHPVPDFYAPIAVPAGDFSMRALEASATGSRPETPVSLSMSHTASARASPSPALNSNMDANN